MEKMPPPSDYCTMPTPSSDLRPVTVEMKSRSEDLPCRMWLPAWMLIVTLCMMWCCHWSQGEGVIFAWHLDSAIPRPFLTFKLHVTNQRRGEKNQLLQRYTFILKPNIFPGKINTLPNLLPDSALGNLSHQMYIQSIYTPTLYVLQAS